MELLTAFISGAVIPLVLWILDHRAANRREARAEIREKEADERAKAADERARIAADREQAAHERAMSLENEAREMRRRGDAPRFILSEKLIAGLYVMEGGDLHYISATNPCLLCAGGEHTDAILETSTVFLVIENVGQLATLRNIESSSNNVKFGNEPDIDGASGLTFFSYLYKKQDSGKPMEIRVSFESKSGRYDTHTYETIHGERMLKRIDPA